MKFNKLAILFMLTAAIALSGCGKDFLNQQAPDVLTTENFWRNKQDALSGLSAAYSQLEHFVGWDNYIEARSVRQYYRSDFVKPGADAYNYAYWIEIYKFTFTAGNYGIGLLWSDDYKGINFSNQVIEHVSAMSADKIDAADQKQIVAEARLLRAWYYFDLIKNFKQVVLRDKVPTGDPDIAKPFATREEIWDFIIKDLTEAYNVLPKRSQRPGEELGRATKGAAAAYLGKAYLYRAGEDAANKATFYKQAADWLQKVVDSHEYSLDGNFLGMFNGTNENGPESIFELQQSPDISNGAYYESELAYWIGATELNGYGEIYGTPALVMEMTKEGKTATDGTFDKRAYQTIFFNTDYFSAPEGHVYGKTYADFFGKDGNAVAFRKWIPATLEGIQQDNAINMPLMRYADVLLMLAESLNETGNTPKAVALINEVRTVHGKMSEIHLTDKNAVFKQIIHERVMEFTLERGDRFYDLRRWGLLESAMQAAGRNISADKAWFPVPTHEMLNNPALKK